MAIHTLSIDLETFSDVDLKKCGVYKYAESPDFEILLFGVSVDGGEVTVYDLASGDTVPEEIIRALSDDSVIKWAYNASFERVCLSVWLRRNYPQYFSSYSIEEDTVRNYLDPSSWRCSLVWGAYMGLPLSLEGIGKVLKLENQKMAEGKALIRYFCVPCKPTKANGGRTRNLPEHDPVKWSTFIAYNKRDVETEMAIQQKLSKFPVPDFLWEEYHLDQEINDRGIQLDMVLVEQAIAIDERSREELSAKMRQLTALENPNSVQQMKEWLTKHGLEVDSLDKKAVKELSENRAAGTCRGAGAAPAACQVLREEVPGHAERRMCGRQGERDVPVLWCQPQRPLGGQADSIAEPAAEPHGTSGGREKTCPFRRLRPALCTV